MATDTSLLEQICEGAHQLCQRSIDEASALDIRVSEIGGATVLDFAVGRTGTLDAGVRLTEICLGGQASVEVRQADDRPGLGIVKVQMQNPLEACIGGQYAGWPLSHEKYFAMGSGPFRMLRGKEPFLLEYGLTVGDAKAVGVLESNQLPPEAIVELVSQECDVPNSDIVLCVARTASLPGAIQIVGRSVETTLHKLHELNFDLKTILSATGQAPIPPTPDDDMVALGWTNDAILYGASVHLNVNMSDDAIEQVLDQIPSCSSSEFGTPFGEIFKRYEYDFYKIDRMLFSPARVTLTNEATGRTFETGSIRDDVLKSSFSAN